MIDTILEKLERAIPSSTISAPVAFLVCYWMTAYIKPFHVDEFFSYVYADRCTFGEIIRLKEFGIGHPPLFHLLQKVMIEAIPNYYYLQVRFLNFFAGIILIWIFAKILSKHAAPKLFIIAISSSAAIMKVFVFSRMWGLVCLFSAISLLAGEKYISTNNVKFLAILATACTFGYFSDYSFVLLMPYIFLVLTYRFFPLFQIKILYAILLPFLFLSMGLRAFIDFDKGFKYAAYSWAYHYPMSIPKLSWELTQAVIPFVFIEPFLITALFIALITYGNKYANGNNSSPANAKDSIRVVIFIMIFVLVEGLNLLLSVQVRYILLLIASISFLFIVLIRNSFQNKSFSQKRISHAILAGLIILLTVSPFFWRDLRNSRYLAVLLPIIFLWIVFHFDRKPVLRFSFVMIASSILYLSSKVLSDYLPPSGLPYGPTYVYENHAAYADYYFHQYPNLDKQPLIIDMSFLDKYCSICKMGTEVSDRDYFDSIYLVARDNYDINSFLKLHNLKIMNVKDIGLSTTDRFQLKYFTLLKDRFLLYKLRRNLLAN